MVGKMPGKLADRYYGYRVLICVVFSLAAITVPCSAFVCNIGCGADAGDDLCGIPAQSPLGIEKSPAKSYTPRPPIHINSDMDFTPANGVVSGSGSDADPFIISGWDIDANATDGIVIDSTTASFFIRDCFIHGGKTAYTTCLKITNTCIGTVENNLIVGGYDGIHCHWVTNVFLTNNEIYDFSNTGIHISYSISNTISRNIVQGAAYGMMFVSGSNSNTVIENAVMDCDYYGVKVQASILNKFWTNDFINNYKSSPSTARQATDESGGNIWNLSNKGNYWSDWTSPDNNSDAVVDIPYYLDGGKSAADYKPIVWKTRVPAVQMNVIFIGAVGALLISGFVYTERRRSGHDCKDMKIKKSIGNIKRME